MPVARPVGGLRGPPASPAEEAATAVSTTSGSGWREEKHAGHSRRAAASERVRRLPAAPAVRPSDGRPFRPSYGLRSFGKVCYGSRVPRDRSRAPRSLPSPDWLGLGEASSLLGVSPATIRRWSDAGRLKVFTTPGGHRRFSRSALERLLPSDRGRRPALTAAGVTPARLVRAYRREARRATTDVPWLLDLTDQQRELFRQHGRALAVLLLAYLDAEMPRGRRHQLREASAAAAQYGRIAAGARLSLSQTVEGFLRFRAPFLHELAAAARRRGFDAAETTDLLETAEAGMDQLLVATMTGHSVAGVGRPHQATAAGPDAEDAAGPDADDALGAGP